MESLPICHYFKSNFCGKLQTSIKPVIRAVRRAWALIPILITIIISDDPTRCNQCYLSRLVLRCPQSSGGSAKSHIRETIAGIRGSLAVGSIRGQKFKTPCCCLTDPLQLHFHPGLRQVLTKLLKCHNETQ